jgi:hypothetical protein
MEKVSLSLSLNRFRSVSDIAEKVSCGVIEPRKRIALDTT